MDGDWSPQSVSAACDEDELSQEDTESETDVDDPFDNISEEILAHFDTEEFCGPFDKLKEESSKNLEIKLKSLLGDSYDPDGVPGLLYEGFSGECDCESCSSSSDGDAESESGSEEESNSCSDLEFKEGDEASVEEDEWITDESLSNSKVENNTASSEYGSSDDSNGAFYMADARKEEENVLHSDSVSVNEENKVSVENNGGHVGFSQKLIDVHKSNTDKNITWEHSETTAIVRTASETATTAEDTGSTSAELPENGVNLSSTELVGDDLCIDTNANRCQTEQDLKSNSETLEFAEKNENTGNDLESPESPPPNDRESSILTCREIPTVNLNENSESELASHFSSTELNSEPSCYSQHDARWGNCVQQNDMASYNNKYPNSDVGFLPLNSTVTDNLVATSVYYGVSNSDMKAEQSGNQYIQCSMNVLPGSLVINTFENHEQNYFKSVNTVNGPQTNQSAHVNPDTKKEINNKNNSSNHHSPELPPSGNVICNSNSTQSCVGMWKNANYFNTSHIENPNEVSVVNTEHTLTWQAEYNSNAWSTPIKSNLIKPEMTGNSIKVNVNPFEVSTEDGLRSNYISENIMNENKDYSNSLSNELKFEEDNDSSNVCSKDHRTESTTKFWNNVEKCKDLLAKDKKSNTLEKLKCKSKLTSVISSSEFINNDTSGIIKHGLNSSKDTLPIALYKNSKSSSSSSSKEQSTKVVMSIDIKDFDSTTYEVKCSQKGKNLKKKDSFKTNLYIERKNNTNIKKKKDHNKKKHIISKLKVSSGMHSWETSKETVKVGGFSKESHHMKRNQYGTRTHDWDSSGSSKNYYIEKNNFRKRGRKGKKNDTLKSNSKLYNNKAQEFGINKKKEDVSSQTRFVTNERITNGYQKCSLKKTKEYSSSYSPPSKPSWSYKNNGKNYLKSEFKEYDRFSNSERSQTPKKSKFTKLNHLNQDNLCWHNEWRNHDSRRDSRSPDDRFDWEDKSPPKYSSDEQNHITDKYWNREDIQKDIECFERNRKVFQDEYSNHHNKEKYQLYKRGAHQSSRSRSRSLDKDNRVKRRSSSISSGDVVSRKEINLRHMTKYKDEYSSVKFKYRRRKSKEWSSSRPGTSSDLNRWSTRDGYASSLNDSEYNGRRSRERSCSPTNSSKYYYWKQSRCDSPTNESDRSYNRAGPSVMQNSNPETNFDNQVPNYASSWQGSPWEAPYVTPNCLYNNYLPVSNIVPQDVWTQPDDRMTQYYCQTK